MARKRKLSKAGPAEKIFDRLTIMVVHHELFLGGAYGPVSAEQETILNEMVAGSKEIASLVRKLLE
jgi:hypothetical protein